MVFDKWFRLDVRPFKHSLLANTKKWARMYKQHLISQVTDRLATEMIHSLYHVTRTNAIRGDPITYIKLKTWVGTAILMRYLYVGGIVGSLSLSSLTG